ncbi:uncharacterized protein TNCV_3903121 [Trichonephila clavipes]|nr:uncharacterized protein TNCV_3903121 [Trichonephila clavipes]
MMWFVREEFSFGVRSLRRFQIISPSLCSKDQRPASLASSYIVLVIGKRDPSWCQRLWGRSKTVLHNNLKLHRCLCTCGDYFHKEADSQLCGEKRYTAEKGSTYDWKYPGNLESPSVISRLWQRLQDDGNVSRCYSTGRSRVTTLNEDWYIWQLPPKETDGAQHQTCLVSSLQLPVR